MRITAIIDCYNSKDFLEEAIASVLGQSRKPDEFLIVDDASTDGSAELAKELTKDVLWARVIEKPNGGQLSCMTAGILEATGDLLAFLDGDDYWLEHHLEAAEEQFEKNAKLSMYFSDFQAVGEPHVYCLYDCGPIGQTQVVTATSSAYVGGLNSALVVKATSVQPYLPLPTEIERDWVVNADNIMIWLTSLHGGEKYAEKKPGIGYRVHPNNNFKKLSGYPERIHRKAATERFFEYCRREFFIPLDFAKLLPHEYRAHPVKCSQLRKRYIQAANKSYKQLSLIGYLITVLRIYITK